MEQISNYMSAEQEREYLAAKGREALTNAQFPAHKHAEFIGIIVDLFPLAERRYWSAEFPVMVK